MYGRLRASRHRLLQLDVQRPAVVYIIAIQSQTFSELVINQMFSIATLARFFYYVHHNEKWLENV